MKIKCISKDCNEQVKANSPSGFCSKCFNINFYSNKVKKKIKCLT